MQMGYHRAGWYTDSWYSWVDKFLFRIERPPSAGHILPQFQHLEVGDTVPDGPPGTTFFTVAALEPQQALVLYSTTHLVALVPRSLRNNPQLGFYGDFSWSFILDEGDESTTRLILRTRARGGPHLFMTLNNLLLPPADFLIVRLMLRAIKQRVERSSSKTPEHVEGTTPQQVRQDELLVLEEGHDNCDHEALCADSGYISADWFS